MAAAAPGHRIAARAVLSARTAGNHLQNAPASQEGPAAMSQPAGPARNEPDPAPPACGRTPAGASSLRFFGNCRGRPVILSAARALTQFSRCASRMGGDGVSSFP